MKQLDSRFIQSIELVLEEHGFSGSQITSVKAVFGGSINQTYCLVTKKEKFFIKINDAKHYPGLFEKEKAGLELLRTNTSNIVVPNPICVGSKEALTFLLMEFIPSGTASTRLWSDFGHDLAQLHLNTAPIFGLDHDNYIGSLTQLNKAKDSWTEFFIENRLMVQEKMAVDQQLLDHQTQDHLAKLYVKLDQLFPEEPPALIHGDLWSGNFMVTDKGKACLIDPAMYYGHREMDIAMTHLFGGFASDFYSAYQEAYPMENGWEQRIELCNLYPLLVHVNLFGSAYTTRVKNILRQLVG